MESLDSQAQRLYNKLKPLNLIKQVLESFPEALFDRMPFELHNWLSSDQSENPAGQKSHGCRGAPGRLVGDYQRRPQSRLFHC